MEYDRPQLSRKAHQKMVQRRRERARRRRRARLRRLRMLRALRSARFWARAGTYFVVVLSLAFWAKFAYVYDIPADVRQGVLGSVRSYVVVKSWWFGPPVFDLQSFDPGSDPSSLDISPEALLAIRLGRYRSILNPSEIIWTQQSP